MATSNRHPHRDNQPSHLIYGPIIPLSLGIALIAANSWQGSVATALSKATTNGPTPAAMVVPACTEPSLVPVVDHDVTSVSTPDSRFRLGYVIYDREIAEGQSMPGFGPIPETACASARGMNER
jgi:hypothetical protein